MLKLNVSHEDLIQVKAILKQYASGLEAWAYGSRIKGSAHDASDLDLVLRNPLDLQKPIDNLAQIKQAFIDSDLPFLIDLMDWAYLQDSYREEIDKQHVQLSQDN